MTGQRFGRLAVVAYVGHARWEAPCDCGNTAVVLGHNVRLGRTSSCGCGMREARYRTRTTPADPAVADAPGHFAVGRSAMP